MDSASSTEPHIVQVLLTSHCRQIERSTLRYLHCTLPASPSCPASRNTRTHTHTPLMQAVQTVQTDCMYTGDQVPFHAFHCLFSIESLENLLGPNGVKSRSFCVFRFHRIFFLIEKKCAKTRPELLPTISIVGHNIIRIATTNVYRWPWCNLDRGHQHILLLSTKGA